MIRPIFFDTETTGVKIDKDRIIEIAAYDPTLNKSFTSLIHPGISIPEDATAIHGITDHMVASAPSFNEVGAAFKNFCDGEIVLVAHNGDAFDIPFLENEYQRHGITIPKWLSFDTLKWARKYRPDLPRHSLQHLREIYQIPPNQAHRALDDVYVLFQVFSHMVDDLSMEHILQLMVSNQTVMRFMPFGKHKGKSLTEIPKDYVKWLKESGAFDKAENAVLKESFLNIHGSF